jgi:hypothetical protein
MNTAQLVAELANLRPNATFLQLDGYVNKEGEVSNQQIIFHMSYKNALEKSIDTLCAYMPQNDLFALAKEEQLASYRKSLLGEKPQETYAKYVVDGEEVKGAKEHIATGALHIYGLCHRKHVLVPGVYKVVNSAPLTVAKAHLRSLTVCGKFRQYKIQPDKVNAIKVENLELLPQED